MTIAEKKIEWVSHHVDIHKKKEQLEDWYKKLNPNSYVPTLDHDGKLLIESLVIMQYLDEAFDTGNSLVPQDAYLRGTMRIWMDRFEYAVHKAINALSHSRSHSDKFVGLSHDELKALWMKVGNPEKRRILLHRLEHGVSEAEEASAIERIETVLDMMETQLEKTQWLCGDQFTLADIAMAPYPERFEANKLDMLTDYVKRPRYGDWVARVQSRPAYAEAYSFPNPDAT
jgi:glutathione S-transferase